MGRGKEGVLQGGNGGGGRGFLFNVPPGIRAAQVDSGGQGTDKACLTLLRSVTLLDPWGAGACHGDHGLQENGSLQPQGLKDGFAEMLCFMSVTNPCEQKPLEGRVSVFFTCCDPVLRFLTRPIGLIIPVVDAFCCSLQQKKNGSDCLLQGRLLPSVLDRAANPNAQAVLEV